MTTIKVTEETRRGLKVVAAITGEKLYETAARLVTAELKKLGHKEKKK